MLDWLIIANWHMKGILSKGLRWLGIVVGMGLTISGIFPIGYAIFVNTIILQIPAASDEAVQKIATDTTANIILHQMVGIGLFGVVMLPFWTILTGRRLLREKV
jgi:ABC-type Mn2+/Zn2+ transport system permease subunit